MKTVVLNGAKAAGRVALVDDEDYQMVMQYKWHVEEERLSNGSVRGPYAQASIREGSKVRTLKMHILVMGRPWIDHIDHNGLNNQKSNLRPATRTQNEHNSRPRRGTSSHFKGVNWHKPSRRWVARLHSDGKQRHLGAFANEEDAARAYDAAARVVFGVYAFLNFPDKNPAA